MGTLTGGCQKDKEKVTFGMIPQKKEHYGIMMYHKNRLIKAYEKVGCQVKVKEEDFTVFLRDAKQIKCQITCFPCHLNLISWCPTDFGPKGRSRGDGYHWM